MAGSMLPTQRTTTILSSVTPLAVAPPLSVPGVHCTQGGMYRLMPFCRPSARQSGPVPNDDAAARSGVRLAPGRRRRSRPSRRSPPVAPEAVESGAPVVSGSDTPVVKDPSDASALEPSEPLA